MALVVFFLASITVGAFLLASGYAVSFLLVGAPLSDAQAAGLLLAGVPITAVLVIVVVAIVAVLDLLEARARRRPG